MFKFLIIGFMVAIGWGLGSFIIAMFIGVINYVSTVRAMRLAKGGDETAINLCIINNLDYEKITEKTKL